MSPDLAERLRAAFIGELEEQVRVLNADLLALEREPADPDRVKSLFRVAHTIKGAARAAGVPLVAQACHALESLLAQVRDGRVALDRDEFTLLFAAADALADAARRLRAGEELRGSPIEALHGTLTRPDVPRAAAPAPRGESRPLAAAPRAAAVRDDQVKVNVDRLDGLMASAGQLLVARREAAAWTAGLGELHTLAARTAEDWRRQDRASRQSGDALRRRNTLVEENLRRIAAEAERLSGTALRQSRALDAATDDVLRQVRQLRVRPFAEACEALPRVVRDVAAASGKQAELIIEGGDVEADRAVLDGLREALLHLVRNAVDHGIEAPDARARARKPPKGRVTVAAALREGRIVVTVADDGAGLDVNAIRTRMEELGLPVPDEEREVARALFQGGLSTRGRATEVSGRGVGLDLVRAALANVRGTVDVAWQPGRGTTLSLECPPSLATLRALLATVSSHVVALPTAAVERLLRVSPEGLKQVEGRDVVGVDGETVPLVSLGRILAPIRARPVNGPVPVVLLRAGGRRAAVAVDELLSEEEIVLQPLNRGRQRLPLVSGGALLGTGRAALVLDAAAVVARVLAGGSEAGLARAEATPGGRAVRGRILLVDDSITTRTLEQSILEAAGYTVTAAVDGADAWALLQEHGADLVVADVEMPRMDGFALCETIRSSTAFAELPVVLVTALESPADRARGLEAGADAYIGKSTFDQQELLDTIRQLLD